MYIASWLSSVEGLGWWVFFWALFFYRHLRLVVNLYANLVYRPIPIPEKPKFTSNDVTAILPTVPPGGGDLQEFERTLCQTLSSVCALQLRRVIVVTTEKHLGKITEIADRVQAPGSERIVVLSVETPNKRNQIVRALPTVETQLTLLIDDDVKIPQGFMPWVLAPFQDDKVGGVGTNQRLIKEKNTNMWNFLGAMYLERRNFDCTACNWIDGGLPCLSGRAVMYRAEILLEPEFMKQFVDETWSFMGSKYHLNVDDDNFITRWLFSHDWKIKLQNHPDCEVATTLQPDSTYLKQCVRWQRSNWRSNMTSLFSERNVWRLCPWSTYAVFITTLTQWATVIDALLFYLLHRAIQSWDSYHYNLTLSLLFCWCITSKYIKFVSFFARNTDLIRFAYLIPIFGYFHNIIKLYSLFTIHETAWGNRQDADSDESKNERLRRRATTEGAPADEEKALASDLDDGSDHMRRRRSPDLIVPDDDNLVPPEAPRHPSPLPYSNDYSRSSCINDSTQFSAFSSSLVVSSVA